MESSQKNFVAHYIKVDSFRTVYSTGIFGGITPHGLVDINFYLDRAPIPTRSAFQVLPNQQIGPEVERESKDGIIREVQFGVLMTIDQATALRDWLNMQLNQFDEFLLKTPTP